MFPTAPVQTLEPALADTAACAVAHFYSTVNSVAASEAEALERVFACSPFVAEYAAREPQYFAGILNSPTLTYTANPAIFADQVHLALATTTSEEDARSAIRQLRYREMVRIAWRDLNGLAALDDILCELSSLADALISGTLKWLEHSARTRYGLPLDEHGEQVALVVLAMGKLGGGELNFSSDIDLIFLYRGFGETSGGARTLSNQDYFDRLGKRLIAFLNDTTADGFVYRVDMRLRPFGDSGQLTICFAALEHYYQVHGRDWERYALIKGRVIGGNPADVAALEAITRPFVYRRYLDFGALDAVREMKALITTEITKFGLEDDVKRGAGGIREIEFIGQMFQLIRGGREPRLRQRGILAILDLCHELGLLAQTEVAGLIAAYRFLRITEHRLQQVHDQQTQALPTTALERARLAYGMGFVSWVEFSAELASHRRSVEGCFASLLTRDNAEDAYAAPATCWSQQTESARTPEILAAAGFADGYLAHQVLEQLHDPRFLGRLSVEARARLDRLMPSLIVACAGCRNGAATLQRLTNLVRAIARRSVYIALLAENRDALKRLVGLCDASPWIARELTATPILLDELLDSRNLFAPPSRNTLEHQLDELLAAGDGDLERVMDALRVFKHQQVLRVAASDLMARFPIAEVSNQLTSIAEVLIDRALAYAWEELVNKHGRPRCGRGDRARTAGFVVIAYGKLGGLELGYGSDLDLVFVHEGAGQLQQTDGVKPLANDVFFTRLAQRIIHLLATRTAVGTTYDLDVRLRPSGAAGLLVTSLTAFAEYQTSAAWTWEHQALTRARAVAGSSESCAHFDAIRREVLRLQRDAVRLRNEIVTMRERMRPELDRSNDLMFDLKQGAGGITDIEFMVQYAILRWAAEYQVLSVYTDNLRLLDLIADLGLFVRADSETLRTAYFAYRAETHRCALQEIDGLVENTRFSAERTAVSAVWTRVMLTDL